MKNKILMLIIGILIGAVITAGGFLFFGGNKERKDFDPSKMKDGNFNPPSGFSKDKGDFDFNNIDLNNIPEKPNNI